MSSNPTPIDQLATNQTQKEALVNALFSASSSAMLYGRREQTSGGLVWGFYGGVLKTGSGYLTLPNGTITLADDSVNYVEARLDTGAVEVNSTGFTPGRLALYLVEVESGVAVSWVDHRQALLTAEGAGALAFTDLTDTPVDYAGQGGKVVKVNAGETGLEFSDEAGGGASSFTDLTDTPVDYTGQAGKIPAVNAGESGLEFIDLPEVPEVPEDFTDLGDTPSSYTGQAGKIPAVNAGESGLEFIDLPEPPEVPEDFTDLGDTPADYTGQGGKVVAVKTDASGLEFVPMPSGGGGFERVFDDLDLFPGQLFLSLRGGLVRSPNGDIASFSEASTSLPDDSVVYVEAEVNEFGNVFIYAETSGWTPGRAPLWLVETAGGEIVSRTDMRPTFTFQPEGGSGGASSFTDLTDTPVDYTGQAGKIPAVNAGESGLEFIDLPEPPEVPEDFTDLGDTPSSYTGQAGKIPAVNAGESGLEFIDLPEPPEDFTDLGDTPADYTGQGGKVVAVKGDESGLEFISAGGGGGASAFTDLTDTPADYTGASGHKVVVNSSGDGLEFVPDSTGSDVDWVKISGDFQSPTSATAAGMESMAIGPGAETVPASPASMAPSSAGNWGDGNGYLLFPTGPLPFTVGSIVTVSGFPEAGPKTYGNYGLDSLEDPTTVVLDSQTGFSIGNIVTVADSPGGVIDGDYEIVSMSSGGQTITLGDGFSATEADLSGATFTSYEPSANGDWEVQDVFFNQLNLLGFSFNFNPAPAGSLVSSKVAGGSVAIGPGAVCSADRGVALGSGTVATRTNTVELGGRVLGGLVPGVEGGDAVTLNQVENLLPFALPNLSATTQDLDETPHFIEWENFQSAYPNSGESIFGKLTAVSFGTGEVSSWDFRLKVFKDSNNETTIQGFTLTPVDVVTAHEDINLSVEVVPGEPYRWRFVLSFDGIEPTRAAIFAEKLVVWSF